MKPVACEFEAEVLASVLQYRWPDRVDSELRDHAVNCTICSEVAAIAAGFQEVRETARQSLPDAGHIWRSAQIRARHEAAAAAGRPIHAAQWMAFACAVGLLGACLSLSLPWLRSVRGWIATSLATYDFKALFPAAGAAFSQYGVLALVMAALLVLIPGVVYLAILKE